MTRTAYSDILFTRISVSERVLLAMCLLMVQALFWSLWLTGLSVLLILIASCINWSTLRLREDLLIRFKQVYWNPVYLSLSLIWWVVLLHPIWTGSLDQIDRDLLLKLPYLALPIAFGVMPSLSHAWIFWFIKGMQVIVLSFCVIILVGYFANVDYALGNLESGKSIQMPGSHIRTSLLISLCILWSIIILWKYRYILPKANIVFGCISVLFLFVVIHVFAVKSGLVTTYLGIGAFILWSLWVPEYRKWSLISMFFVILIPIVSYHFIPSFQKKIEYTLYDWEHLGQMEIQTLSDVERWNSIEVGWYLFKEKPITGVGYAQLGESMKAAYQSITKIDHYDKKPHNQWLYTLTAIGIVGALFVFPGLLFPYFLACPSQQPLLSMMGLVFLSSTMVESTIETSYGMNFHLLFTLIAYNYYRQDSVSKK